jgi:hypothetical protein
MEDKEKAKFIAEKLLERGLELGAGELVICVRCGNKGHMQMRSGLLFQVTNIQMLSKSVRNEMALSE